MEAKEVDSAKTKRIQSEVHCQNHDFIECILLINFFKYLFLKLLYFFVNMKN